MRADKLAIRGDNAFWCGHLRKVRGRIDRQAMLYLFGRARAAEFDRLRIENSWYLLMKQAHQHVGGMHEGADQLGVLDGIEQDVRPVPFFPVIVLQDIGRIQKSAIATVALRRKGRRLWHKLQHHSACAPTPRRAIHPGLGKTQRKSGRQLL